MKKIVGYLFIIFFLLLDIVPCGATSNEVQLNRVVVTFSPLVVNNLNCTDQLYEVFKKLTKNNTGLSDSLEASGALWSISQNLCGLQISLCSSKGSEELCNIIDSILTRAYKDVENIITTAKQNVNPVDRIFPFFINQDSSAFTTKPVTINFYNSSGKEIENYYLNHLNIEEVINSNKEENDANKEIIVIHRHDFIKDYCDLYDMGRKTNLNYPKIQNLPKPILVKFIGWNNLTPDTFITASLIKNRLIFDDENEGKYLIELFNTGKGLVLAILCEVERNNLYSQHLLMNKKIDSAVTIVGPKEWEAWSSKLLEVLKNDRRDFNKKAMFDAWCEHWGALGFNTLSEKVDYKKPDYFKDAEIFSSLSEHVFYFSSNSFPVIYACNDEIFEEGANVAICLEGNKNLIDGIENSIRSDLEIGVPITINKRSSDRIVLSFYCQDKKIPAHLSRIKSLVANYLYTKFKVTDLKNSIKIGIAGISKIPSYQLQGLLNLGWPSKSAKYDVKEAKPKDLYEFVKNNSSDEKILKSRWKNLVASPQDKAYVLSVLACHNLTINSWEK